MNTRSLTLSNTDILNIGIENDFCEHIKDEFFSLKIINFSRVNNKKISIGDTLYQVDEFEDYPINELDSKISINLPGCKLQIFFLSGLKEAFGNGSIELRVLEDGHIVQVFEHMKVAPIVPNTVDTTNLKKRYNEEQNEFLNSKIRFKDGYGLRLRAVNALRDAKFEVYNDILKFINLNGVNEMLNCRNFGKKSLIEVIDLFSDQNIPLTQIDQS